VDLRSSPSNSGEFSGNCGREGEFWNEDGEFWIVMDDFGLGKLCKEEVEGALLVMLIFQADQAIKATGVKGQKEKSPVKTEA
jgi:hypothetical protein